MTPPPPEPPPYPPHGGNAEPSSSGDPDGSDGNGGPATEDAAPVRPPLTLDRWVALNEEIRALGRSGIAWDLGAGRIPGLSSSDLEALNKRLRDHIRRGHDLEEAAVAEVESLGPLERAVLEAGRRAGDPGVIVEGLARIADRDRDLRGGLLGALLYPTVVITLAYGLMLFLLVRVVPEYDEAGRDLMTSGRSDATFEAVMGVLMALSRTVPAWGWIPPVLGLVMLVVMLRSRGDGGPLALFGAGRVRTASRSAFVQELLATLIAAGLPVAEAVRLTASSLGGRARRTGLAIAEALEQDRPLDAIASPRGSDVWSGPLPARLIGTVGESASVRAGQLQAGAEIAHLRALEQMEAIRLFAPAAATVFVGLAACLTFALSVVLPFRGLLDMLNQPLGGP